MKQSRKRAVPAAIMLLIVFAFALTQLITNMYYHYQPGFFDWFYLIVLASVPLSLLINKNDYVIAGTLGAMALYYLISFFEYFAYYKSATFFTFVYQFYNLCFACALIAVAFIFLVEILPSLAVIKEKILLIKKILNAILITLSVFGAVIIVYRLITIFEVIFDPYRSFTFPFLAFTTPWMIPLFSVLSVLMLKNWLFTASRKEKDIKEEKATEAISEEFFVSLGKHICLLIFTCGVWQLIWIYKATKFSNLAKGQEERSPVAALFLNMFVPFYSIFWTYKTAERIDKIAKERNVHSEIATTCLILSIFVAFLPPIFMQDKINQSVMGGSSENTPSESKPIENKPMESKSATALNIDDLKKLKDLLDAGVITEEEFKTKKKQILDL